MSLRKTWLGAEYDTDAASVISESLSLLPVTASLLVSRGYTTKKSVLNFINRESAILHDSFLLPDMEKAVLRIEKAVNKGESITVYGDYDVDGITGVSILVKFLRELTDKVSYYIPDRNSEGYGINAEAVRKFADDKVNLMLTVDTGITANEEVSLASSLGIDTIITDHHECRPELPEAVAVVNPKRPDSKYPFRELAGVGVAFKLICAYNYYTATGLTYFDKEYTELNIEILKEMYSLYADIVTFGTVADVMPVVDENRLIIAYGLHKMAKTQNTGLRALLTASDIIGGENKRKITASTVSFTLAPRINAVGRIRCATRAVELFLTDDAKLAQSIANEFCDLNRERQSEENIIIEEVDKQIAARVDFAHDKIIILDSDTWHQGIIGIVASRITEKYNLPSILITFDGDTGIGKGSGRSIAQFNLIEAITACSEHLTRYGGHALAAGLSVTKEQLTAFRAAILRYASEHLSDEDAEPKTCYDIEVGVSDISLQLCNELSKLEPFGSANPAPLFMLSNMKLTDISPISQGKHLKLTLSKDGASIYAMYFNHGEKYLPFIPGDGVDILFNLNLNEFKGIKAPQVIIRDIRFSEEAVSGYEADEGVIGYIKDGFVLAQKIYVPGRADCAAVFRIIRANADESGVMIMNMHKLLHNELKQFNYIKLRLILDIFAELGFIECRSEDSATCRIKLNKNAEKAELTDSHLYTILTNNE